MFGATMAGLWRTPTSHSLLRQESVREEDSFFRALMIALDVYFAGKNSMHPQYRLPY